MKDDVSISSAVTKFYEKTEFLTECFNSSPDLVVKYKTAVVALKRA